MFAITKLKRVPSGKITKATLVCSDCGKKATILIGAHAYCAHCGDGILLRIIKDCINAIEEAVVKIKIIPKGALRAKEKSSART
jgi:DNA-directed RNA polymerase subunit RPC12/RpoP